MDHEELPEDATVRDMAGDGRPGGIGRAEPGPGCARADRGPARLLRPPGHDRQPCQRWPASPASYSRRRSWTAARSEISAEATSHHTPAPGRFTSGSVGTTMTLGPGWARASSRAAPDGRCGRRARRVGAEATGHGHEVELEVVAVEGRLAERAAAPPELVAEALPVAHQLEPADDLEAVVLGDHDGHVEPLLERGDQLGRLHQERPVADERDDRPVGLGQSHAERRRQLVAHARIAEFEVDTPARRWRPTP